MNTNSIACLAELPDVELLSRVKHLTQRVRRVTTALIAHLAELDRRRLYLGEGWASLFTYCTEILHLSEAAAYRRILVARAARRFPAILAGLDGSLNLTSVRLLALHLSPENHAALLDEARHGSRRQVERIVARVHPQPAVPTVIRKLPARAGAALAGAALAGAATAGAAPAGAAPWDAASGLEPAAPAAAGERGSTGLESDPTAPKTSLPRALAPSGSGPSDVASRRRPVIAPLAPDLYKVQFTASRETYWKLRRVQDLMRHQVPDGDPAMVIDRALTLLLRHLEATRLGATRRPRGGAAAKPGSRHVPAEVRRALRDRDGEQRSYVGRDGHRCRERGCLELHHVEPHGVGGPASAGNLRFLCRQHNQHEAREFYGPHRAEDREPP